MKDLEAKRIEEIPLPNRYSDPVLLRHTHEITDAIPEDKILRIETAELVASLWRPGNKVLDLGAGQGDSSLPLLQKHSEIKVDLVDVSSESIEQAKERLAPFAERLTFVAKDALAYLLEAKKHQIIFADLVVHNFPNDDKRRLLKAIYENLTSDGVFINADKILPDDEKEAQEMHDAQMQKYREKLSPEVAEAIIAHETEDMRQPYRTTESEFVQMLQGAGFEKVRMIKRVKRSAIILASKL